MTISSRHAELHDDQPKLRTFRDDVVEGLSRSQKELPCKYFYDDRGSALFEKICQLDEYYLTRTELAIMRQHVREMAQTIGPRCMLVEFGPGSGLKTRLLLDHLREPVAYVPIDISKQSLIDSVESIIAQFPHVEVLPMCTDFTESYDLPVPASSCECRIIYFPGSTMGNFGPKARIDLLRRMAEMCNQTGGLLIGIDLKKDTQVLEAAYNDRAGVTREFNLNILVRANRELGTNFDLGAFEHTAFYSRDVGCIEMRLVSLKDQVVSLDEQYFAIREGETILTERSYKFSIEEFSRNANQAGVELRQSWTDKRDQFSVLYLS